MAVTAVSVFGWVSYQRLSVDLMPDIVYPALTVRTEFPGTAPEEVETLISRPLEQQLGLVANLVSISSISKAGQSDVVLEFDWDTDMNGASQEIREKIDRTFLPEEAARPLLLRYDPSLDPILRLGLTGPQSLIALRELADLEIKRELESLAGVAAVKVRGGLEEEIHVALNEAQMTLLNVDIGQINTRLQQANVNVPGGLLREGQTEYLVRTLNEFQSLEQIRDLVIASRGGAAIRLRHIAEVTRTHEDREMITRVNGRESVEIQVFKEADANIVSTAEAVRNRLYGRSEQQAYVSRLAAEAQEPEINPEADDRDEVDEGETDGEESGDLETEKRDRAMRTFERIRMTDFISHNLPAETTIEVLSDQSEFILEAIREVQKSALVGGIIAVFVLFLFLRSVAHTVVVGVTIPVSIVATFAPMFMFDVSLNIMSLGGLALGIGMLVDNSIVVLENIFRCREEGDGLLDATVRGAQEVGGAVSASTLTTIAVFFPIVFVEGIAGQVFGDMALTVVFSLLASLAVALYLIPMLASRRLHRDQDGSGREDAAGDFAKLKAFAILRQFGSSGAGALSSLSLVPMLLYEVVMRVLFAVFALIAAALKAAVVLLVPLLWLVAKLLELWMAPKRTFYTSLSLFASRDDIVVGGAIFDRLWPGLLAIRSLANLQDCVGGLLTWVWRMKTGSAAGQVLRVWKCLLFVPAVALYIMRFAIETLLALVGVASRVLVMTVALLVVTACAALAALTAPLVRPLLACFDLSFGFVQRSYPPMLSWALRQRLTVVGGSALLLWLCVGYGLPRLGSELIPQVHQGEFSLELTLPVGTPLARTAQVATVVEGATMAQAGVERVATIVGTDRTAVGSEQGEHTAKVTVKMVDGSTSAGEEATIGSLRHALADLPELDAEVSHPVLFSFKTPIEIEIRGYDLGTLRRLSEEAVAAVSAIGGLEDVRSSLQVGHPELQIIYDRERLSEYELELRAVAELVRNKVQGKVATDFRTRDRNISILVRLREGDRLGPQELRRLVVNPAGEIPIPLSAVADVRIVEGPSEIRRIDQERAALVTANIAGIDLGRASERIQSVLDQVVFPAGFDFLVSGQNKEMKLSLNSLLFALALAAFLVYVVMASQFESLLHPLVIMFTVPLALVGVTAALFLTSTPLSIVVFLGMIMLTGIVVNNAIILVDYINRLRRDGMEKSAAIAQAASVRLRPIFMTTSTTALALTPMAIGLGEGAEIRTPMALTVIAGLVSSTVLTLIVIPTVYSLVDRHE